MGERGEGACNDPGRPGANADLPHRKWRRGGPNGGRAGKEKSGGGGGRRRGANAELPDAGR